MSGKFVFLPPPQKFEDVAFDIERGGVLDLLPGEWLDVCCAAHIGVGWSVPTSVPKRGPRAII